MDIDRAFKAQLAKEKNTTASTPTKSSGGAGTGTGVGGGVSGLLKSMSSPTILPTQRAPNDTLNFTVMQVDRIAL